MTLHTFLLSVTAVCILAQSTQAADPLKGAWEGYVVEGKGEKPNTGIMHIRLEIDGTKMAGTDLRAKKPLGEGTFKIDADGKGLDATGTVMGAGKDRTYLGIYAVDGDTLRWCVSNFQVKTRPEVMESKKAQFLMVLKRVKS